ncbi:hypothetical protein ACFL0Q_08905, partial [Thermodesulfobacteriota bacterium]
MREVWKKGCRLSGDENTEAPKESHDPSEARFRHLEDIPAHMCIQGLGAQYRIILVDLAGSFMSKIAAFGRDVENSNAIRRIQDQRFLARGFMIRTVQSADYCSKSAIEALAQDVS